MIPCANPTAQFFSYQDEIEAAVLNVMRSNRYILGPEVEALESEFSSYIGSEATVGVASGTDALIIALRALDIGAGDEVITVSHTAVATVAAIEACGAIPVLVDIDPAYFTLNPEQLSEVVTSRTRAVIVVHLYGQAADLDIISEFCVSKGLALIEDVAQAHGAKWRGKRLGGWGRIGCFSCYPTKNLGAIGDAGLITTSDLKIASKMRSLREYGWRNRYISEICGLNSRLDEIQAAILRVKLRYLDADNQRRSLLAAEYSKQLAKTSIQVPAVRPNGEHVYHLYVVRSRRRDALINYLKDRDIYAGIHYPSPIHLQPAYRDRILTAKSMTVTEEIASELLSLPIYPEMSMRSLNNITNIIREFD